MQRPAAFRIVGQRAENRVRAGMNQAVGFNELDGGVELFGRNFRELLRDARVLRRKIIHGVTGHLLPAPDPERAEIAITVKNHERFWRRRGNADAAGHDGTLNHRWRGKQHCRVTQAFQRPAAWVGMSMNPQTKYKILFAGLTHL